MSHTNVVYVLLYSLEGKISVGAFSSKDKAKMVEEAFEVNGSIYELVVDDTFELFLKCELGLDEKEVKLIQAKVQDSELLN